MALADVQAHLKEYGADNRILEMDISTATVLEAANALGCEPARIAKTLSLKLEEGAVLIVMAGDAKLDNKRYKAAFGRKAAMVEQDALIELVGHPAGGVCPFGVKDGVKVYLDTSLKRFHTVFPACGSANSCIELTLPELEEYARCERWVEVSKGWER